MSRLPYLRRAELDEQGVAIWDSLARMKSLAAVNEDGGLAGPFNVYVHAPEVGSRVADLGSALLVRSSVPRRTLELVVITVGAHWKAEFEWYAHTRMAREYGVPDSVITAIGNGEEPPFDNSDDRVIYQLARQLLQQGQIDDATYAAAQQVLGHQGLVEIVALCGYYTLISFLLNGFAVPLPAGEPNQWAP